MKSNIKILASFFYRIAELLILPLMFLTNNIIGRLLTVLIPGKFGNASTIAKEIRIRIGLALLIVPLIIPTLISSILWVVFNFIGDLFLGKQLFLVLKGHYRGPMNNTFATWNVASLLPPCTLVDGVSDSNRRTKAIGELLKDFQFVCCQEMGGAAARYLSKQLKNHFAEFYTYIGKSNYPFISSGLFFATKEPVISVNWYPYQGKDIQKTIRRGLVVFELEQYYVVTTHLDGDNNPDIETVHLEEIQQALKILSTLQKPIIFCADLNEDRYNPLAAGYKLLITQFPDVVGDSSFKHVITDTDLLYHDRFGKKTPVNTSSIDFLSSNQLPIHFLGLSYFYYLTDHYLLKGEIKELKR